MGVLTDLIPTTARKWVYGLWALAGLVLGSLQVAGLDVEVYQNVYAYVSAGIGATALANTTSSGKTQGAHVKLGDVTEV